MENSVKYMPVDVPVHVAPLAELFVEVASAETVSHDAHPYLEVVAPVMLPEGYTEHAFTVKVPVGGVERGQKFSVPFLPGSNGYSGSRVQCGGCWCLLVTGRTMCATASDLGSSIPCFGVRVSANLVSAIIGCPLIEYQFIVFRIQTFYPFPPISTTMHI
jgi:hypothetical protein